MSVYNLFKEKTVLKCTKYVCDSKNKQRLQSYRPPELLELLTRFSTLLLVMPDAAVAESEVPWLLDQFLRQVWVSVPTGSRDEAVVLCFLLLW